MEAYGQTGTEHSWQQNSHIIQSWGLAGEFMELPHGMPHVSTRFAPVAKLSSIIGGSCGRGTSSAYLSCLRTAQKVLEF